MTSGKAGVIYQNDIWDNGTVMTKVQLRKVEINGHKCLVLLVLNFNLEQDYSGPLVKRIDRLLPSLNNWINTRRQVILPKNRTRSVAESHCLRVLFWTASFLDEKDVKRIIDELPTSVDEIFRP